MTKIHFFHENKMTKLRTTLTCLVLCLLHSVEGEELREEQIIAPVMETCRWNKCLICWQCKVFTRFLDHANGVVMPEVPHWTVKDCPCYHRYKAMLQGCISARVTVLIGVRDLDLIKTS